ncbi:hypothetical protein DFS33DRAFT_1490537 [Desarmillaria ectypa]|nr:hypothetical protein DFS33DRAFT_1490537 [Desarmillaria ectypa]
MTAPLAAIPSLTAPSASAPTPASAPPTTPSPSSTISPTSAPRSPPPLSRVTLPQRKRTQSRYSTSSQGLRHRFRLPHRPITKGLARDPSRGGAATDNLHLWETVVGNLGFGRGVDFVCGTLVVVKGCVASDVEDVVAFWAGLVVRV